MRISFRQGIVRHQTDTAGNPSFLQLSGGYVNLQVSPDFTIIAFTHGTADYLYTEQVSVNEAWGPFTTGEDYWLYWDLNLVTGFVSRSFTTKEPVKAAVAPTVYPGDPGQMWFDTSINIWKEFNGSTWIEVVRVLSTILEDGVNLRSASINAPLYTGTQVGLTTTTNVGSLVFDHTGSPIMTGDGRKFFTTENIFTTGVPTGASLRVNDILIPGQAQQPIGAYHVVQFNDFNKIVPAEPLDQGYKVFGIVEEDVHTNEVVNFVTEGVIFNEQWDWVAAGASVNTPVYIDNAGQIVLNSTIPDQLPVGVVIDFQSIIFSPGLFPQVTVTVGPEHAELAGLDADDHPQYHDDARGDARYYTQGQLNLGILDSRYYTETEVGALLSGKSNLSHTHVGLVPPGGTIGQVLKKTTVADYDYAWDDDGGSGGGGAWGTITGTLSDQLDLQLALDGKANVIHTHVRADIIDGIWIEALDDIADVDAASPADGQVLTFNTTSSKWEAQPAAVTGATILPELNDVDSLLSPTDGEFLVFNNTTSQWETQTVAFVQNLPELNDVLSTIAPTNGQVLTYDGANTRWDVGTVPQLLPDLSDVQDAIAPVDGQVLTYDGINSEWIANTPDVSVTDHGMLSGLGDDDHPQYHNDARGDARYYQKAGGTVGNVAQFGAGDVVADSGIAVSAIATQDFVNNRISGLSWKHSVKAATITNVDLVTGGTLAVDGYSVSIGERVLVMSQTLSSENGIYVVSVGTWVRADDMNTEAETNGAAVFVEQGSVNVDTTFTVTGQVDTLGTDPVVFAQFGGGALPTGTSDCQILSYNQSGSSWDITSPHNLPQPYDIACQVFGNVPDDKNILLFVASRKFQVLDYGHQYSVETVPTVSGINTTFDLRKNGVSFGSIVIFTNGKAAVDANPTTFDIMDKLTIHGPLLPDATMTDLGLVVRGMMEPTIACGTLTVAFAGTLLQSGTHFNPLAFDGVTVTGTHTHLEWAVISYSVDNVTFYPMDDGTAISSGVGLNIGGQLLNYNSQYYTTDQVSPAISEAPVGNRYYKVRVTAFGPAGIATDITTLSF